MSELKSILNEIDPEVQENSDNSFYNVPSYEYVYDAQSQQVKKKNIMSMFEPGGFYADPTGDRTQKYIKERYIDAPTKTTKTIAKEIPLVVSDTLDTIAEEFTDFGDNVLFYTNKYNPVHTLGEYPLPDEKNIFYDQEQGKGNIRSAWDFYRTGNGLIEVQEPTETKERYKERQANNPNKFYLQEPETAIGGFISDTGSFLVPWIYGTKIVQTPQTLSRGKKYLDRAFRWAVSGAGVEFIYGTESKEDESILGLLTGFSPTGQTGLKTLMHHSFLSGHDADQFANHLDHAINSGIDEGILSFAFSGLGHMFKSTYFKMFPDELKKSIGKAWQRDHGIAFTKFAERNPGVTNKDTLIKYIKQPNVKKWLEDNSRIFFRSRLNVDDFANKYKVEVMGPVQVGNRAFSNGFDPLSNGYTTYKNNIVKIYKRMLANKNPLMVFLGAGAAYTAMSSSDAEAGILNKTIQKYFEKGGQKLFQRGANNKLVPMTHDDVLAMPVDKEIYIQPQEAEGEWVVHANKDEYLASEDGYDANPLDLLPNQKYPYYDTLAQKIDGMNFETMPKEQFINTINNMPGIKKDEIEATELVEFVNSVDGNKISKQDLLTNWYDNSRVVLKTRLLGSDTGSGEMEEGYGRYENYITPGDYDKYKEHLITFKPSTNPNIQLEYEKRKLILGADGVDIVFKNSKGDAIKYEDLDIMNYAELFAEGVFRQDLSLNPFIVFENSVPVARNFPATETEAKIKLIDEYNKEILEEIKNDFPANFQSSHFSAPNILAHTRSTERNIDGTPTFFIEEVQSDWHQLGMKKGYMDDKNFNLRINDINRKIKTISKRLDKIRNQQNMPSLERGTDIKVTTSEPNISEYYELQKEYSNLMDTRSTIVDMNEGKVPDAPFKNEKDWVSLSLKEMVYFAASKGYDKVAWTSGRLQNERYDIGNYVDELKVTQNPVPSPEYLRLEGLQGEDQVFSKPILIDKLDETVGKSLADKIRNGMENAPDEFNKFGLKFSGLDLNLSGQGKTLQRFYDNLIPSLLKKMYEKDGVEFGKTSLITNVDAQPAPLEEMMDDLYNEAAHKVVIVELDDDQIAKYNKTNEDFLEEQLVKKEGYEIYGVVRNDSSFLNSDNEMILDAKEFEIKDKRQIEAPLEKLFAVEKGMEQIPPRIEGAAGDRADDYFQELERETIMDIVDEDYSAYVDEFNSKQKNEDFVERNILYMTIPEGLKDRVLKLGQPLFGTNPSKLGAYENKTTQ